MIEEIRRYIKEKAREFGAITLEGNHSYVERNNTAPERLKDDGAYFGFIQPEEELTGPFHDFSFTIFPSENDQPWLVCLGIGSAGFKNDFELATYPGLRRLYLNLVDKDGYCKSNFLDVETNLPKSITNRDEIQHLRKTIKTYTKFLPVVQIIRDPGSEEGKKTILGFLAAYAKIRDWPSNNQHRIAIANALNPFFNNNNINYDNEVLNLLLNRKYIVLQGPPGTGKTRLAHKIGNQLSAKIFFIQFHAETSYSDFVYGIKPDLESSDLIYVESLGCLIQAIKYANNNPDNKVLLIIDEINRANLSNVLGPVFYLFEYHRIEGINEVSLSPKFSISSIPQNLFVIATMNTADRSLAVVDFALRRRFAWYELRPVQIRSDNEAVNFYVDDFQEFKAIFDWYASSDELSLQPGQGYFLAESDDAMKARVKYELLPLIQEYLREGLLISAKEEFNTYFLRRIGTVISQ